MRLPSLLLLLLTACTPDHDLRDYYFPVRSLTDGLVYEYENTGTLPGPDHEYYYYLGLDQDTALYLSITRYAPDGSPEQLGRERLTNEGVVLESLTLMGKDSAGVAIPAPTAIERGHVFPFLLTDPPPPAGYRLSFTPPDNPDATTIVTLTRKFLRDTVFVFAGEAAGAVLFELAGEVSLRDPVEGDISPTFTGYEIWAEGLGLVEYHRDLGAGGSLGGRLVRRLPMTEFAATRPAATGGS